MSAEGFFVKAPSNCSGLACLMGLSFCPKFTFGDGLERAILFFRGVGLVRDLAVIMAFIAGTL